MSERHGLLLSGDLHIGVYVVYKDVYTFLYPILWLSHSSSQKLVFVTPEIRKELLILIWPWLHLTKTNRFFIGGIGLELSRLFQSVSRIVPVNRKFISVPFSPDYKFRRLWTWENLTLQLKKSIFPLVKGIVVETKKVTSTFFAHFPSFTARPGLLMVKVNFNLIRKFSSPSISDMDRVWLSSPSPG